MTAPSRPILRWHGGKWRLAPWVIAHFPPHTVYVEPFGGAASVLLRKQPAISEIWNDLDDAVVGLFRVLRERPRDLAEALALTPFARAEYRTLYEPTSDPVEAARRLIGRSFMGQSSKGALRRSGFDSRVNPDGYVGRLGSLRGLPEQISLIADRFSRVLIEHTDASVLMRRHDRVDALFFVDPPYLPQTRHAAHYNHELTRDGHAALLTLLRELKGMVVLAGYPSRLYDDALGDWRRVSVKAFADGARERTEVLWINPACAAALDTERKAVAGGHGTPLFEVPA